MSSSTSIDYSAALDYVNSLSSLASKVESLPKASENAGFQKLEELGLAGDFPSTFDSGVSEISNYISTVSVGCNTYLEAVRTHDQSLYDKFIGPETMTVVEYVGPPPGNGGGGGGGGGGGCSSNGGNSNQQATPAILTPDKVEKIQGEEKAVMDNTDKQEQYLSEISMDELDIIISLLKNIANEKNIELDKLFDEQYADLIKEQLLSELKVSQEFRDIVDEGSSISLVNALKSLVDGKLDTFKIDEVMATTLVNVVNLYASNNGTTYQDIMSGNSALIDNVLKDFMNVSEITSSVNEASIQEKLLAIYEGNGVNSNSSDLVKEYVEALMDNTSSDYETLLTDSSFKEKVYNETDTLNRMSKYADLLSNCSKDQIIKSLKEIASKKSNSSGSSSATAASSSSSSVTASSSSSSVTASTSSGSKEKFVFSTQPLVTLDNIGG